LVAAGPHGLTSVEKAKAPAARGPVAAAPPDEQPSATIEEAALAASSLIGLTGASYDEAAQTLRAMAERATSRRRHTGTAFSDFYGRHDHGGKGDSATLRAVEDYTSKYKGEQVEVALFGGDYHEGVLTAYCAVDEVAHIELNGHILIPLQNIASLHCTSRCDAPEPDWPPRGFAEDERDS